MNNPFENDEMLEILESYLIESGEILEILTSCLMELENNPDDIELINKIFRYFHTIKGTSSFMGFENITGLTHAAEDLLNKTRHGELKVNHEIIDVLMDTRDRLDVMTVSITNYKGIVEYDDLTERLNNISQSVETSVNSDNNTNISDAGELPTVFSRIKEFEELILNSDTDDELYDRAFEEVNNLFRIEDLLLKEKNARLDSEINSSKPDEIITPDIKNDNPKKDSIKITHNDTIRIEVKSVESLMDLSGELVLGRNRLAQLTKRVASGEDAKSFLYELIETANQIDMITSQIQTSVMKMRMVPISKLFQKAPKIIRDLSKEFGKKINLVLEGEDTEIDKGIIEELNDPLVHMLRNSCDHGIENENERLEAGKTPAGTIKLTAYHEGNHIIIKITDDGRGIDPNKILSKAVEKNFISKNDIKNLIERDILQLIFKPGFSTAKNVTSVSGRGVGMDVVKTNINKLKGIIDINSAVGKGSEFTVKLPLTLAIIQGLLVKSSGNIYALPLSSVLEVVAFNNENVNYINNKKVIRIRNEVLPLITLDNITGDLSENDISSKYVVNLAVGIERIGLIVEELLGQQEIVIKSLGNYLTDIEGIAGSTIIGDGRVIMILDIHGIINKYKSENK